MLHEQFREALRACDLDTLLRVWAHAMPHLPQPSRDQAETIMHRARTEAESLPLRARAYSHHWLVERGYPSGLPDRLRKPAERLYPRAQEAVGFAARISFAPLRPAGKLIERAVHNAIEDVYANEGPRPDVGLVKRQMKEAKEDEARRLFGRLSVPSEA
jgi:hypothetical protein